MEPRAEFIFGVKAEKIIKRCWDIYVAAFAPNQEICAQDQMCLTEEDIREAMLDEEWVTFLLWGDETLVGFTMATANLEKGRIGYISPPAWEKRFSSHIGNTWYYPAICIDPEYQGSPNFFVELVRSMGEFLESNGGIGATDVPESKNPQLPEFYAMTGRTLAMIKQLPNTRDVRVEDFDRHIYARFDLVPVDGATPDGDPPEVLSGIKDQDLITSLWEIFTASYAPIQAVAAQDPVCFSRKAFNEVMADPDWNVIPLRESGKVIGFGLATHDEDKSRLAFYNPPAWQGADRKLAYFAGLCLSPDHADKHARLAANVARYLERVRASGAFCYSELADPKFPAKLMDPARQMVSDGKLTATKLARVSEQDAQRYVSIILDPKEE